MKKTLYRSRENKVFGGVAGGMAEYFDVDPVLIRIAWVIGIFTFGLGFLAYIILMFIMPKKPYEVITNEDGTLSSFSDSDLKPNRKQNKLTFGIILIVIGVLFFINNMIPQLPFHLLWPVALIVIGAMIIFKSFMNGSNYEVNNEN
jgi:phage shock protein C